MYYIEAKGKVIIGSLNFCPRGSIGYESLFGKESFSVPLFALVFHIFLQPSIHLIQGMKNGFFCRITMAFEWQKYQSGSGTMSLQGVVIPFALHRKSTRIVIGCTMEEKYGAFYLVSMHERRHVVVNLRGLPIGSLLILKPKRG